MAADARISEVIALLEARGVLTSAQMNRGRRAAELTGERLDHVLNRLGLVDDEQLLAAYADITGIALRAEPLPTLPLPDNIEPGFLRTAGLVPIALSEHELEVVVSDPFDDRAARALARKLNRSLKITLVARSTIENVLSQFEKAEPSDSGLVILPRDGNDDLHRLRDLASEAPVIRLVNELIDLGVERKATDLHFTATAQGGRVRLRLDGALEDCRLISPDVQKAVVSRLKIMAGLDIGENRVPQDGRLQAIVRGKTVDLRISTMPHMNGEGAFVRILEHRSDRLSLSDLGFEKGQVDALSNLLRHPNGLFLVTGPTGSGKTTTLYALLRELHHPSRNIVTVEDPIEYRIEGINQIQINRRAGLDFPKALRSVLRQDPDIILVGEIRDRETASIAVQAALTGHFVLATLHTNDASTVVDRLIDMGIEPFLLAAVLRGAMAQRLVRRRHPDGQFAGRIPLAEIFDFTSAMRELVTRGGRSSDLQVHLERSGFIALASAGERLVKSGRTSREELMIALGS